MASELIYIYGSTREDAILAARLHRVTEWHSLNNPTQLDGIENTKDRPVVIYYTYLTTMSPNRNLFRNQAIKNGIPFLPIETCSAQIRERYDL